MAKPNLKPDQVNDIRLLYKHGVKASLIAKHFKISAPTVSYHVYPIKQLSLTEILTRIKANEDN